MMKRFLLLILGTALLGAAPTFAQQPGPSGADHAAALLRRAQEAAAQGHAQHAAELASAAAALLGAQQQAPSASRAATAHAEIAKAAARAHAGPVEVRGLRVREAQEAVERERAAAEEAAEAHSWVQIQRMPMAERGQEPGAPGAPGAFRMRLTPEGEAHSGPAAAPRAPQRDDLGMTLKLIHAEVQALRAEVQALRAEMSLMRAHGGASVRTYGGGAWTTESKDGKRQMIIVGPDGKRIEVFGHGDDDGEWATEMEVLELEDLEEEAALLEDVLEELNGLGYVDSITPSPEGHVIHGDFRAVNRWHAEGDAPQPDTRARLQFQFNTTPPPAASPAAPGAPAVPAVPAAPAVPRSPR